MRTADRFCDLAGYSPDKKESVVFAHDGSRCTLIEIFGVDSILSADEFHQNIVERFSSSIAQILKRPGHQLAISFESSANIDGEIDDHVARQKQRAGQKSLGLDALIEEGAAILGRRGRKEKILMAVWTRPNAGVAELVKAEKKDNDAAWKALPPAKEAQNPFLGLESIEGQHEAFVKRVMEALADARFIAKILGPEEDGRRPDLEEIRRAVLHNETPAGWSPFGPGTRKYPGAVEKTTDDVSDFFAPTIARQILTSNAQASSDLRALSMGGRQFAIMVMRMFPANIMAFNSLLNTILEGGAKTADMPFRICLHIEALNRGDMTMTLRKVISGLLAFAAPSNRNIFEALRSLQDILNRDQEAVVKARLAACTWVEPGESPQILEMRRSYLTNALMTWGDCVIADAAFNPLRGLCETVPGMIVQAKVPPGALAPLGDLAAMLPFHRTAPIFSGGQTMFLTPEGKLMPYAALSSEQLFWLTVIFATPGSGKSVLMNRLNIEFAAFSGGARLPFMGIIDVGVSSSGFIELIRNALPPDRRHEAYYIRLLNDEPHAINPFDLGLGRRKPLPREKTFVENFLLTLLGANASNAETYGQLATRLVSRLYAMKSDLEFSSSPSIYQPNLNPELDKAISRLQISVNDKTKWWRIVDELVKRDEFVLAMRAQRYATPILEELSRLLGEEITKSDFGEETVRIAQRAVEAAIEKYPMFSRVTRLDLGEARIVSIDLQDVAQRQKNSEAERNNALMFMIARHAFLSKISGVAEELASMELPTHPEIRRYYMDYWEQRYSEISETPKRLCMDEYHLTGGVETIARQVNADVREGRKWGLEVILASQLLQDFSSLADMASTVIMLNADSNEIREEAKHIFGFSDAVKHALEKHVHGPKGAKGANFLARIKLRERERFVILNSSMGPIQLWALTTQATDRRVRDELYKRMSVDDALRILAKRYPTGTAVDHWAKVERNMRSGDGNVAQILVDQIVGEWLNAGEAQPINPRKIA